MSERIGVKLGSDIVYVTGSVNDVDKVFTLEGDMWVTTADKADDETYRIILLCADAAGNQTTYSETVYMGIDLIFDRKYYDVEAGTLKGQYNWRDLNRVEDAVSKISKRLRALGYTLLNPITKTDWHAPTDDPNAQDTPTLNEMERYRNNVLLVRLSVSVFHDTPKVPASMRFLDYEGANAIEKALYDVKTIVENMEKTYRFCGTFYSGEG